MQLRISDCKTSDKWLNQFEQNDEKALAAKILNGLKLVSHREFEQAIIQQISSLQVRLNSKLALYPIMDPTPTDISGYDLFGGGISNGRSSQSRLSKVGKRKQYGSEDRVGHILTRLSEGSKNLECCPTIHQLKTQNITNIVFVDDMCGSGRRLANFWKKSVPKTIKSLLSSKKIQLWVVLYAASEEGLDFVRRNWRGFRDECLLIGFSPDAAFQLNQNETALCHKYARKIYKHGSGLGFANSFFPVVFEHGCPNNLPPVFWESRNKWVGLFPKRSIPAELTQFFGGDSVISSVNQLAESNQNLLALSILERIDANTISNETATLLAIMGMIRRNIGRDSIHSRVYQTKAECDKSILKLAEAKLVSLDDFQLTDLGISIIEKFRKNRFRRKERSEFSKENEYIPYQCEGKLRQSSSAAGEIPVAAMEG